MNVHGPRIYFEIPIFGGIHITDTVISSFLVMVILCTAAVLLGRKLTKRPGKMQVLVEKGVTMIRDLVIEAMGPHNAYWTPYIATLFLSSLLGSLIGVTGVFRSSTADLNTTATWAVMTSVLCWYNSIKNFGLMGWLKGFTEPFAIMTPMNLVSELAQPVSLAFRHFGNIVGGSVITTMIYWALAGASSAVLGLLARGGFLIPAVVLALGVFLIVRKKGTKLFFLGIVLAALGFFALLQATGVLVGVPILQIGIPAVLSLYFDFFSGLIQAFVFSLLTMIYISNACPSPEEIAAAREEAAAKKAEKAAKKA